MSSESTEPGPSLSGFKSAHPGPRDPLTEAPAVSYTEAALALIKRRLERERAARKQAELLLTDKSRELYQALQGAREAERQLSLALWASGESIWEWEDRTGQVEVRGFALSGDTTAGATPTLRISRMDVIHPEDRIDARAAWLAYLGGERSELEFVFRLKLEDQWRWVRARGRALERPKDGRVKRIVGTLRDITEQRAAEEELRLLSNAFEGAREPMLMFDRRARIRDCNRAFLDLMRQPGLEPDTTLFDLLNLEPGALEQLLDPLAAGWRETLELRVSSGALLPVELSISRVFEHVDGQTLLVASLTDLSLQRSVQARIQQAALHDGLTGLANRAHFESRLKLAVARADVDPLALLWINLDGFRAINDSLGHAAGDAFLYESAQRLMDLPGERDELARIGGDEFAVLMHGEDISARAANLARTVIEAIGQPMQMGERMVCVTASVGISLYPEDAREPDLLLQQAEAAMHKAKQRGRARAEFHRGELSTEGARRLEMITELRRDLDLGALTTVVQPKVSAGGYVVGHEILMRWNNARLGPVSPAAFIPLSEEFGLVGRLGLIAMEHAAAFAARLLRMGLHTPVALNLSPRQVFDPDTEYHLVETCRRHLLPHDMLEIELTESALLENIEAGRSFLRRLSEQGFKLALDDFGTGFSSLAYLRRLPFNTIKIDRCFMDEIDTDPRALRLLQGMVALCQSLDIAVVAEGVETDAQRQLLVRMGVDQMQGFLFARPQPADVIIQLATRRLPLQD
jgi:diguanylate cyclase (GGDEF)-like protein